MISKTRRRNILFCLFMYYLSFSSFSYVRIIGTCIHTLSVYIYVHAPTRVWYFIYVHIWMKAEGRFYTIHKLFKTAGAVCLLGVHAKNWILSQVTQHDNMLLIQIRTPRMNNVLTQLCDDCPTIRWLFYIYIYIYMFDIIIINRTLWP